jgi:predicted NBD/HSP70 family sugar kinase
VILVFDLGGTKMRVALAEKGKIGEVLRIPTDRSAAGFGKFLGSLQEVAEGHRISAIGGCFPGQLQGPEGELVVATNLPEWRGLKLSHELKQLLDVPVHIANDVEMCGLGEARFGAGITDGVMAYYTVSTGVNAVRLVDGEVDQTVSRYELGKQIVGSVDGAPVALEPLIGGAALQKRTGQLPHDIHDPAIWRELERSLATGLYNTALHWNPELVVMGGSMMHDIKVAGVAEALHKFPNVFEQWPRLEEAQLGDEAGIRGAMVWLEQLGYV